MKKLFIMIAVFCLILCACSNSKINEKEEHDKINDANTVRSDYDDRDAQQDITLPLQWENIELPEIDLDNPGTEPITDTGATSPASEPETSSPTNHDSGAIELPEDTFGY